tara:strand:+ start:1794 stop:2108 length:315 start_codon:yes stop_codon:yes gene_type:complete
MKKINKIIIFISLMIFLANCGGMSDVGKVLRNEKTSTTDEFLVKKKEPLVLPPDFDTLPEPGSANKVENNGGEINKILKIPKNQKSSTNKATSIEKSILNKINK